MTTFNQSQLRATLKAVEEDLEKAFASAKEGLVKAEGDEKESSPAESSDDAGGSSAPASSTPDSAPAEPPAASPPAAAAAPAASPGPESAPPASAPAPGQDPAAAQGGGLTVEALQAEYGQLAPDELDMHIQAALAAKEALMAASAPASAPAPGASAPASAGSPPPASPPAGAPPPAMKAEIQDSAEKKAQGGEVKAGSQPPSGDIKKSESDAKMDEILKLVKEQADLIKAQREELDVVQRVMVQTINKPMRKSLTAEEYAARTAEPKKAAATWTPADLKAELRSAISSGKLTKSERDDVVAFYDGKVKAEKLAPIIEKLQQK